MVITHGERGRIPGGWHEPTRYAHSRFCVPSLRGGGRSETPIRSLASPSAGPKMAVPAVSTSPATVVSARSPVASAQITSTAM